MGSEAIQLVEAIIAALAPIIGKMVEAAMSPTGDPLAPLAAERPGDIIPEHLKLQLAEAAARARIAAGK